MFKITSQSKISRARAGVLTLPHGQVKTPFFMPDATRAVVKHLSISDLRALKMPAMVVNTFHLYLQPGMDLIKKAGGVNEFMKFSGPLLSDSGGFQVFSLLHKAKGMGKISEDGVTFKSPLDGKKHWLDSRKSIQVQFDLGTDMIVAFDDCPPNDKKIAVVKAVERTIAWAKICRDEYDKQVKKRKLVKKRPLFFGVIQGGEDKALRRQCAEALIEIGFDGYGFGARPVDKDKNFLGDVLGYTADLIPENQLRFGLGIGTPEDIVRCVQLGWDMFDCVIPTREGRHGRLFVRNASKKISGKNIAKGGFYQTVNIKNSEYKTNFKCVNKESVIKELREYSFAYLHHLFKVQDPLGQRVASLNNLEFYLGLMEELRLNIIDGKI